MPPRKLANPRSRFLNTNAAQAKGFRCRCRYIWQFLARCEKLGKEDGMDIMIGELEDGQHDTCWVFKFVDVGDGGGDVWYLARVSRSRYTEDCAYEAG